MGDPKKEKKKYSTPVHPWQRERILQEKEIIRDYGMKNKKEIWKIDSKLRAFKNQAKNYSFAEGRQADKQRELFMQKLVKLGLLGPDSHIDNVLGLEIKDILERRLQTLIVRKGFASTMKQARQFIVHNHISISEKKINVPGYLVKKEEEANIKYAPTSSLAREDHPEITSIHNKKKEKKPRQEKTGRKKQAMRR